LVYYKKFITMHGHMNVKIVRVIKSITIRWAVHVAHMGERRGVYWVLGGKPENKKPLGRPRRSW